MDKALFESLREFGIIPLAKVIDADEAATVGKCLLNEGIFSVRVPVSVNTFENVIRNFALNGHDLLIAADGVSSVDQVRRAVGAGAKYVFLASFDSEVVGYCLENGIAAISRVESGPQVEAALKAGMNLVSLSELSSLDEFRRLESLIAAYPEVRYIIMKEPESKELRSRCWRLDNILAMGNEIILASESASAEKIDAIASRARAAVKDMHGFDLLHLGINCRDTEMSLSLGKKMEFLFGFALRERPNSLFAGMGFEFMKSPGPGENGHIAIGTNDVSRAAAFLKLRGIEAVPGSERYNDNGTLRRVYLELDIGGFAVHLRRFPPDFRVD